MSDLLSALKQWHAEMNYVVYSREHNAWWGPNHCGYFCEEDNAGRYTKGEAEEICRNAGAGRTGLSGEGPHEFCYQIESETALRSALPAIIAKLEAADALGKVIEEQRWDMGDKVWNALAAYRAPRIELPTAVT